jgi:hypothetical protein
MSKNFESSKTFPWFVYNKETFGFDADAMAQEFFEKGYIKIYNDGTENILDATRAVVKQVIAKSIQYQDESVKNPAKRLQIIVNGDILEIFLKAATGFKLTRNSDSKWLFNDTYEVGTDFTSEEGYKIEAKVYYSEDSMMEKVKEANKGNKYIFHDALYVCCYLINTCTYQWLKCINNVYKQYNDKNLDDCTKAFLPKKLPLCKCIENNITGEWELVPFYRS